MTEALFPFGSYDEVVEHAAGAADVASGNSLKYWPDEDSHPGSPEEGEIRRAPRWSPGTPVMADWAALLASARALAATRPTAPPASSEEGGAPPAPSEEGGALLAGGEWPEAAGSDDEEASLWEGLEDLEDGAEIPDELLGLETALEHVKPDAAIPPELWSASAGEAAAIADAAYEEQASVEGPEGEGGGVERWAVRWALSLSASCVCASQRVLGAAPTCVRTVPHCAASVSLRPSNPSNPSNPQVASFLRRAGYGEHEQARYQAEQGMSDEALRAAVGKELDAQLEAWANPDLEERTPEELIEGIAPSKSRFHFFDGALYDLRSTLDAHGEGPFAEHRVIPAYLRV